MRSQSICLNILFDRNLIKMVKINRFFTTVNYFQHDTSWEPSGESIHFFWKHVSWHLSTKDGVHSVSTQHQRKKQRFTQRIGHPSNTRHGPQYELCICLIISNNIDSLEEQRWWELSWRSQCSKVFKLIDFSFFVVQILTYSKKLFVCAICLWAETLLVLCKTSPVSLLNVVHRLRFNNLDQPQPGLQIHPICLRSTFGRVSEAI